MRIELADDFERTVRRLTRHGLKRVRRLVKDASRGDVEAVHDMRTGLRRLRTILMLSDDPRAKRLRKGAKRFATALGMVRDLDVALQHIDKDVQRGALFLEDDVTVWREAVREERESGLHDLRRALRSNRYRAWRRRLVAWTKRDGEGASVAEALPVELQRLLREAESLAEPRDESERHELRKAVKRVRYVLEFYEDVLSPDAKGAAEQMTATQDAIGEVRDRLTLAGRAEHWAWSIAPGDDVHEVLAYARRLRGEIDDTRMTNAAEALRTVRAVKLRAES